MATRVRVARGACATAGRTAGGAASATAATVRAGSSSAAPAMQHPGAPACQPFLQQACASRGPATPLPGMKHNPRVAPDAKRTRAIKKPKAR